MINLPDERELEELRTFNKVGCLSIYLPVQAANQTADTNRIELKNLLRQAETALAATGVSPKHIKATLQPAQRLLDGHDLWPPHRESLALFMHPELWRYYHLPADSTPQLLTVATGFNLKPLLKIMASNQPYYALALSHKNVRLYAGDRYYLKRLHLKGFPTDMKQALNIDEYPNWWETHAIAPTYTGKGSEAFHGQYNIRQTDKDMLIRFFRLIDQRLHSFLLKRPGPLLIMGVDYLLPIYRLANSYPGLVKGGVTGNFEKTNLATIHDQAWSYMKRQLPTKR